MQAEEKTGAPGKAGDIMAYNPRWKTGKRRKYQQRFRSMGLPCAICGRPIDYSLPFMDPWAFVIDEKIPVKYWQQAGYSSPSECADDWNNLQPAHRRCNSMKGAKLNFSLKDPKPKQQAKRKAIRIDGHW